MSLSGQSNISCFSFPRCGFGLLQAWILVSNPEIKALSAAALQNHSIKTSQPSSPEVRRTFNTQDIRIGHVCCTATWACHYLFPETDTPSSDSRSCFSRRTRGVHASVSISSTCCWVEQRAPGGNKASDGSASRHTGKKQAPFYEPAV